jgi:glycosyltransferase involved in cell wall biosynthesis
MKLLFYDDSPVFGGHEVVSLLGLDAVLACSNIPVRFITSAANVKLREKLAASATLHPHLTIEEVPWHSSKLEALRNRLLPSRTKHLGARFREVRPSLVIAIQGNIEHSSLALRAARAAGIPCLSYIPVPHSNAEMGARLGSLRDHFSSHLFTLPDRFITITDEMARMLRQRGATAPIDIVYNGVDTTRFQPGDSAAARAELGLPADKTLLGMIGRIEFRQKQQHLLVKAVASVPSLAAACHLVFAGDGPDVENLRQLLATHHPAGTVLPWCDPARLYQALDVLVIPSRYEGLPLVMLEALASATTVFGSDRDGMKDLLPADRRFQPDNPVALAESLRLFLESGCPPPDPALVSRVRTEMSLAAFNSSFANAIIRPETAVSPLASAMQIPHT